MKLCGKAIAIRDGYARATKVNPDAPRIAGMAAASRYGDLRRTVRAVANHVERCPECSP